MRNSLYLLPLPLAACMTAPPLAVESAAVAEAAAVASEALPPQPAIVYPETRRAEVIELSLIHI